MSTPVHRTKRDVAVEAIREAILSGELEPGARLLQDELAERLNVSPTPVREALRQLEAERVLDHSPHKGVRVAEAKLEHVHEIYLIRGLLEALATRAAVRGFSPADIDRLRALQAQIETQVEQGQLKQLRKTNFEFHALIYRAANMPELYRTIVNLWMKFPWDTLHVLPGRAPQSVQEHRLLVQAIEEGNSELAGQRMHQHIRQGARALAEYLNGTKAKEGTDPPMEEEGLQQAAGQLDDDIG